MAGVRIELDSFDDVLKRRGLEPGGRVQRFIDESVVRMCDPYVPMDRGPLKDSAISNTVYGSGEVIYDTPYAAKMYYTEGLNFQGAPMRGANWLERMKSDHADEILNGAAAMAGGRAK